jgi:hypothetical protein
MVADREETIAVSQRAHGGHADDAGCRGKVRLAAGMRRIEVGEGGERRLERTSEPAERGRHLLGELVLQQIGGALRRLGAVCRGAHSRSD